MNKLMIVKSLSLAVLLASTPNLYADDLIPGPGLFSGKSGEFTILKTKEMGDKEKPEQAGKLEDTAANNNGQPAKQPVSQSPSQPLAAQSQAPVDANEFEMYKQWRAAKETNSADYKDFQYWIEYQQFLQSQGKR